MMCRVTETLSAVQTLLESALQALPRRLKVAVSIELAICNCILV